MARYFSQKIDADASLPRPAVGPLLGQQLARRQPIVATMRGQDRVVTLSRRVLLRGGLSGAASWLVPNTDPSGATQTHPLRDSVRVVARGQCTLTPGCQLELRALVGLSGQTQRPRTLAEFNAGAPPYLPGGCQGEIRLAVSWDDGGATVTRTFSKALPASALPFGAAPTAQGGQWSALRVVKIPLVIPPALASAIVARRFCQPTVVTMTLSYVGGARVVFACVSEVPRVVTMEADDAVWTSHVLGATPAGPGPLVDYAYQRLSETTPDGDPRGGTWHLQDVANAQAEHLGPCLLHWTSYDEDGEAVTISENAPVISTITSFRAIHNSSLGAYDESNEGWSLASGAYARTRRLNDPAGMPNQGVIPIRVRAYVRGTDGTTASAGVLRVQSGPYEWVDVPTASGAAAGWVTAWGHARVGRGPGDPSVCQIFMRRTGGAGGVSVWAVEVHHNDRVARVI